MNTDEHRLKTRTLHPANRRSSACIGGQKVFSGVLLAVVLSALFAIAALGRGAPPFRTDDPETPGNQHWEINFGWIGDRNPEAGAYQVPDFDINYGLGERIQLKYEI